MENKVLATVNGVEITQRDLEETISRFPMEKQAYLMSENGKEQVLQELISFELFYNHAKDSGMENDEKYIEQIEKAKKEILTQITIAKVLSEAKVSDKEVEEFYNANSEMFKEPEMVSAKHILVETKEKAEEIANKINEGMSFEEAAKEFSTCPSNARGGELGKFAMGQMVPEFEEVAFSIEAGQISEPVKTQFGYHLIKVEEKFEGSTVPLDKVKAKIKSNILQERQAFKYSEVNNELKKKYNVEINK